MSDRPNDPPAGARVGRLRVLAVSYFFPPAGGSGVVRVTKLARHLPDHGIDPEFLTSRDLAPWEDRGLFDETSDRVRVERVSGLLPWQWRERAQSVAAGPERTRPAAAVRRFLRGWLSFPDRGIYWAPFAIRRGVRMGRGDRYAAVYAPGGPWSNLLVARSIARRLRIPLVADFKEAWGGGPPMGWANGVRRTVEQRWEGEVITESSRVIAATEAIRTDLLERVPSLDGGKVVVVPNGFEPDEGERDPGRVREGFLLVHTGYLSRAFDVRPVLRGLAIAVGRGSRARIRFVGERDVDVLDHARAEGVADRVEVAGPVDHREAVREQRRADALLVLTSLSPLEGGAMPSKTYEYVGTGHPILAVAPPLSYISRFLGSLGLPGAVAPDRPDEIARRIEALEAGEGSGAAPEAVARFRWSVLVGEISRVIRSAVCGESRGREGRRT